MDKKTKKCTKCGIEKLVSGFSLHKNDPSGFRSDCKKCAKEYRESHKNEIKEYAKDYYIKNKDIIIARTNAFRETNKEKIKKTRQSHYNKNKEKLKAYSKEYNETHKEERLKYSREYEKVNKKKINKNRRDRRISNPKQTKIKSDRYREKNKEVIKEKAKAYYLANKEKIAAYRKANRKRINKKSNDLDRKKRKINPQFKLNENISRAIRISLQGNKAGHHWETLVGYTLKQLKKHLEKQFTEGMIWENYGLWHLDHKIPKSVFNYKTPDHADFKKCWALKNLQPMWAEDNIKKSNKLDKHFQPSLLL